MGRLKISWCLDKNLGTPSIGPTLNPVCFLGATLRLQKTESVHDEGNDWTGKRPSRIDILVCPI